MTRTGPDMATRELVRARDVSCVICDDEGEQIHHRRPRAAGGTRRKDVNLPSNLVLLCSPCHLAVERNRNDSRDNGWLIPQSCSDLPAQPLTWHSRTVLLADDGSVKDVTPAW